MSSAIHPYEYHKQNLHQEEKNVYEAMVRTFRDGRLSFSIHVHLKQDRVQRVTQSVLDDHPEFFWIQYQYSREISLLAERWTFQSFYSGDETRRLQREAEDWRRKILSQIPAGLSRKDKCWMICDYLARQVQYRDVSLQLSHTIVGCFSPNQHYVVCESVAKGMKYLCDGLELPCIVVSGEAWNLLSRGPHSWNMIRLEDGRCLHMDATSLIKEAHLIGRVPRRSFLTHDVQMRNYSWDRALYPAC